MTRRPIKAHWFLWVIIGTSFLGSFVLYDRLPEQVPMHWNLAGEVDRYGSRFEGAFAMPLLNAALLLLMIWLPALDPRRKSYARFESFYKLFQWVLVIFLVGMQILTMGWALGYEINISMYVKLATGILLAVLGNYMGKVRSNWFMGIRNPWTMENEKVWIKTHRLAGPLMFGAGVLSIILAFVNHSFAFWAIMIGVLIAVLVPNVYSYILYRGMVNGNNAGE